MRRPAALLALALAALLAWWWSRRPALPVGSLADETVEAFEVAVSTVTGWELPARAEPYRAAIEAAESGYGTPAGMIGRQLWQESRFRPEVIDGTVRSPRGAAGIAQFMPATARELGIDPLDPVQSIDAMARYMRRLYDSTGDWRLALAAYNWGIGNLRRYGYDQRPSETRAYVDGITGDIGYA